ncbi:MAG: trypsin-like peptidase domain-containing protein [Giesbergeria sp.]
MTFSRFMQRAGAVAAALLVVACGGGDSDVPPTPTPGPTADRIEPFDPSLVGAGKSATLKTPDEVAAPRRSAPQATPVRLGPLDDAALQLLQKKFAAAPGVRQQIGVARSVTTTATRAALLAQLQWQATGSGTQRAAISFTAQGAFGVRVGVQVRSLPPGTTLRFYAQGGEAVLEVTGDEVLQTVQRNLDAGDTEGTARTYWSPDFGGPETTLELELSAQANLAQLDVAVPMLSHYFVSPTQAASSTMAKVGEAASCHVDVVCRPELSSESRAVARMFFVDNGRAYLCTGTLLNDSRNSTTPYFLSAHHCISTQSAASSLTTDWFYLSSACNSGVLSPATRRLASGALLLYSDATTDTAFMRLNAAAPQGSVFAGSYFGEMAQGAAVVGLHQPKGDLQKISLGVVAQFSNCANEFCTISTAQDGRYLAVGWSQGTTEPGSSGSGLFYAIGSQRYLVGQLYGGSASCQNPTGQDQYGRFDVAFRSVLKNWLKPVDVTQRAPVAP